MKMKMYEMQEWNAYSQGKESGNTDLSFSVGITSEQNALTLW